jgi:hypothetical protein
VVEESYIKANFIICMFYLVLIRKSDQRGLTDGTCRTHSITYPYNILVRKFQAKRPLRKTWSPWKMVLEWMLGK